MTVRRPWIALASSAAAIAATMTVIAGPSPAQAAVASQGLTCTNGGGSQTMKVDGTAPATATAGSTFTVTLAPQAGTASGAGIKDLEWAFQAPAGSEVVAGSSTTVGNGTTTGGSLGTVSTAVSGNVVFLRASGTIANGATFTPPAVSFDLKATGPVGTSLPIRARTSASAYKLTADLFGGINVVCTATNPINSFAATEIIGDGSSTTVEDGPVVTEEVWTPSGPCGSVQTTVVPADTTSALVVAVGGRGGKGRGVAGASGADGADGGRATATARPTPGSTISAIVGCDGSNGGTSSANGGAGFAAGGNGGKGHGVLTSDHFGGGGGGASAVCSGVDCITGGSTPLVIGAGGGAGGSLNCAGTKVGSGASGGSAAITAATDATGSGPSGGIGTNGLHSTGGAGGANNQVGVGTGGTGGNGSQGSGTNSGGGGGGGGYRGGAGGSGTTGGAALCAGGGGGGGGSSFAASSTTSSSFGTGSTASVTVTFTITTGAVDPDPQDDGSVYVALVPCRILDTRTQGAALGNGTNSVVQVTGHDGCVVPAGATAVEASVSAVEPSNGGFARLWPTGETPPAATFVNYTKGQGTTNTGAVSMSSAGSVALRNFGGPSHFTVDVQGYYIHPDNLAADVTGSVYVAMAPCRVLDTRNAGGSLGNGTARNVQITGLSGCSVPVAATAVEASASAVEPAALGFARLWPKGAPAPTATFVNFSKAQGTTNTGAVSIGDDGQVSLRNFGGPAHYTLDVQGYFIDPADLGEGVAGSTYHALVPCRVLDTRVNGSTLGPNTSLDRQVTGLANACQVAAGATAVEASVSAVEPATSGFARLWPTGGAPATATFVNYTKAQGTTNTGSISVSTAGSVTLRNFGGTSHFVIDVQGYWQVPTES